MKKTRKNLVLSAVAVHVFYAQMAMAMQVLDDHDLRKIEAQDGLSMDIAFDEVKIDRAYWQDNAGMVGTAVGQTLQASANDIKIQHNTQYQSGNYNLGMSAQVQVARDGANQAGLSLDLNVRPFTFSANDFCVHVQNNSCNASIGNLAIQSGSDTQISLITKDGLFNKNSQAELLIGLQNLNIYTGLKQDINSTSNIYNQLILKNTNFNFLGKGVAYIDDVNGFVMHTNTGFNPGQKVAYGTVQAPSATYGYVDLNRTPMPTAQQVGTATATYQENGQATSAGLNLEFMLKKNANLGDINQPSYSLADAKGLIRIGASGRVVNAYFQARGINSEGKGVPVYNFNSTTGQGTNTLNNILGFASQNGTTTPNNTDNPVMGNTGIGVRLYAEFTKENDTMLTAGAKPTTLEIGGAGTNTFGFEFSELHPLIHNSKQRAYFDSGNVYVNLADTQHLEMPVNTVLTNLSRLGGESERDPVTNELKFLTSKSDYYQQIHGETVNPKSIVLAIRGMDFQAVSHRGRFTSSIGLDPQNSSYPLSGGQNNTWGLGLPFYNLNSNIALYPTTYNGAIFKPSQNQSSGIEIMSLSSPSQRLGFALALSVEGKDSTGTKSTSIMVLDAANKYYLGLRNIDMYLRGYGSIGFEEEQFNVNLPDLLMVMAAEIAAGYLPSYVNNTLTDLSALNNPNNILNTFNSKSDVLLGLKIKLFGDMNFSLLPHNSVAQGNRLSIIGRYNLKEGAVQVSDPIDDSMIGLDNMEGIIDFNNAIVVGQNNVAFNYGFTFNPNKQPEQVFKIKDVNLYPKMNVANPPSGQRIGEMALTGGRMNLNLGITPRNGSFQ